MKRRILDAAPPSPRHRMTKRSRNAFTAKEKLHWLAMLESQPDLSIRGLAKLAKVQPKQIREWRRLKERLEVAAGCRRRLNGGGRRAKWPLMEKAVYRQFLAHRAKGLAVSAEVEVLEDVLDEGEDGVNPNPFYEDPSHAPEPAATKDDEAEDEEEGLAGEEDVVDAAAEEGDVMAPEEEGDEADAEMGGADEWSEDGDDWWAAGRYEGEEVEEWVAGEDE
ncbi:unnamed protein product [Closterium sp. NIES-64]|nr:unnamed protein product [Closterium sp. NIES-64]CAI5981061.1 unnamed protein product [Closterium sp. NIES-64]CAI5981397.1 unnamed protein product [Closterium sp. NIES-64]CAI5981905.1 unnamed protein product [Closterium sp. NIES-64]